MTTAENASAHRSPAFLAGATAVFAGVVTIAVLMLPFLRFSYRAPALHVMLETGNALVALLVGYLVYGRYRHTHRLQTLLLALALGTVAVANLALTALPSAVLTGRAEDLIRWAPVGLRVVGPALFFAAAVTPLTVRLGRRRAVLVVCGVTAVSLVTVLGGLVGGGLLPPPVTPTLTDRTEPLLVAHPALLATQALGVVLYGLAAVAFTRQAARTGDQLIRWVGAGCVLAAAARLHYLIYPSLYTDYVYTGDLLRLGGYLLMLVGAAREITTFWQLRAEAAVAEDRRRMARELHDGLTQELSFIWAQSRRLASRPGDQVVVDRISSAADRAIDESRRAIAALTRPAEGSLATALEHLGDELSRRFEVKVVVTADPSADVDPALAEALTRITGEAVRNAVRHGSASRVDVVLDTDPIALTVVDDGCGFPADQATAGRLGGFGLTSMRERAASVGATLTVASAPGDGTTVGVRW